mmetsp:Transcript_6706/g.19615  ORF Transcript_6706/g.19615 Transcript_6706/m.19615 type:complete len:88 (-) Transcript_6706:203-466(-)
MNARLRKRESSSCSFNGVWVVLDRREAGFRPVAVVEAGAEDAIECRQAEDEAEGPRLEGEEAGDHPGEEEAEAEFHLDEAEEELPLQ